MSIPKVIPDDVKKETNSVLKIIGIKNVKFKI